MTYYEVPYFSNSNIKGDLLFASPLALEIGSQFDDLVCGTHANKPIAPAVWQLYKSFNSHQLGQAIIASRRLGIARFQHEFYRIIQIQGHAVGVKCKPDYLIKGQMQIDLKTTSATSVAQIETVIRQFGYLDQMGLYHKICRVKQSGLFFVSKTNPKLLHYRPCTEDELEQGYQNYIARLTEYLILNGLLPQYPPTNE